MSDGATGSVVDMKQDDIHAMYTVAISKQITMENEAWRWGSAHGRMQHEAGVISVAQWHTSICRPQPANLPPQSHPTAIRISVSSCGKGSPRHVVTQRRLFEGAQHDRAAHSECLLGKPQSVQRLQCLSLTSTVAKQLLFFGQRPSSSSSSSLLLGYKTV